MACKLTFSVMANRLAFSVIVFSVFTVSSVTSVKAFGNEHAPKVESKPLPPAKRYNGNTPIEINNGKPFNNGTFGAPNPEYEAWAKAPVIEPGLSELSYPFDRKAEFVSACNESVEFLGGAIRNWQQTSPIKKPEVIEYAKNAVASVQPALDRLKDATKKASGAGKDGWEMAEGEARKALIEARGIYSSLHRNVK